MTADLESGGDGTFRAEADLPAGEYRVSISKPNYADAMLRLHLPLTGPLAVRLVRFGSITGHVTDKQNQPMRGVNVFPMAAEANGQFHPLPMSAQSDETGQYRLYNLAPGRYAVAVSWATMNPGATFSGAYLFPNNQRPEVFSIVSGASLRGIDFVQPAQSEYSVSGRLQIPDTGKGGGVTLVSREQPSLAAAMVRTAPDGNFRFEGIAPGAYDLMAAAPSSGYAGFGVMLDPNPVFARVHVDVGGEPLTDLMVTPEAGRTLRLSLQSETGCPTSATVVLTPMENWGALLHKTLELNTAAAVTAKDLAPGQYRAVVSKPAEGCFGVEQIVDVRTVELVRMEVVRGGTVEGQIESGDLRPTITLSAFEAAQPAEQHTMADAGGRFRFSELRPGRYRIHAGTASENVLVLSNASTSVVLRVEDSRR